MRILSVTHDHPFARGSGVATYCQDLELELVGRGHSVAHLTSWERSWRPAPYLRWFEERGITFASLVNSPLPPAMSPERPLADCADGRIERLMRNCLERTRPDLVHIHAFQGLSGSVLPMIKRHGIPVIVTLHDFWALCTRIVLMRADGMPCSGPDGGKNCARYCANPGSLGRRVYRRLMAVVPPGPGRELVQRARAQMVRPAAGDHSAWSATSDTAAAGEAQGSLRDTLAHGARSARLLEMLREADAVLAVSNFVRDTFVRHGVPEARIRVLRLGLDLSQTDLWRIRQARAPLRVGFLGRVVHLKGAHILAEAVRGIPPDQARVLCFGPAGAEDAARLQTLAGRPLEFRGPYDRGDLPAILDEVDVVVVPSLFPESVGLATLEAQAAGLPVIASRIGAVPEYIQDGQNGLLFEPGSSRALQACLRQFLDTPQLVAAMSARTTPPPTMVRHVDLLTEVYRACLGHGHRTPHATQSA
ncbi:MAG TPA: glycosyltransferase family 4 protein [bacterium]|nr:glycosyltransferase family 4 protein [bacterium]